MSFNPQNLKDRLISVGKSVDTDALKDAAKSIGNQFKESGKISVGGIASAVEGATSEIRGATVDMINSVNGISGPALGGLDLAQGGISQVLNQRLGALSGLGGALGGGLGGLMSGASGLGGFFGGPGGKQPNMLEAFSTYNYVFTLGALTDFELNFPDLTYRYNDPLITIIRSGGGSLRGSRTIYERNGKTEYFIDNVNIECLIAPNPETRGTNAVGINFEVTEPYSMGLFLQALQIAAISAGHKNYIEAPFILQTEFKGFGPGNTPLNMSGARRLFPLKLVNIEFDVTEGGSRYQVTAIPFNESALTDQTQSTRNDITFEGRTVAEMLQWGFQSLTSVMNEKELEGVKEGNKSKGNQYVIMFPTADSSAEESAAFSLGEGSSGESGGSATTQGNGGDTGEFQYREFTEEEQQRLYESALGVTEGGLTMDQFTASLPTELGIAVKRSNLGENIREYADKEENINSIGLSKIVESKLDAGKKNMAKSAACESEEEPGKIDRCKVTTPTDARIMTVSNGKKIESIIEQVILLSKFGRDIVDAKPVNGMVDWFRVETNVYQVTDHTNVDKTGAPPRIFVYRVVPYKVHHSNFKSPTESSKGIDELKAVAAKEYNYIYTGQNKDILNFDINFKTAFFTSIAGDFGQKTADAKTAASSGTNTGADVSAPGSTESNSEVLPGSKTLADINKGTMTDVGGPFVHPESVVAANFNEALVNSPVDLITVDLEIWGDPYYIADSGVGNYSAATGATSNINADGTMDYQTGEVHVEINFRTPIDYVGNYMTFPNGGTAPVGQFNGLYKVIMVSNKFNQGQFTQVLQTIRLPNQNNENAAVQETGAVSTEGADKQLQKTETNSKTGNPHGAAGNDTSVSNAGAVDGGIPVGTTTGGPSKLRQRQMGIGSMDNAAAGPAKAPSAGPVRKPPVYNRDVRGPQ